MSLFDRLIDFSALFFEENDVARFTILAGSAGGFRIPGPDGLSDRHFQDVEAPGLLEGSSPVIFFRTTHVGTPTMSVRLNATPLTRHTFTGPDVAPRSWHEVIPPGALKPTRNELTFAASSESPSDNSVTFSDVVILFTSNKLTVKKPRILVATQD